MEPAPRRGYRAGADQRDWRKQELRGLPGAERPGTLAGSRGPGRHQAAGVRRGVPGHPGAAPGLRAASAGGDHAPVVPAQRAVGQVLQDARRRAGPAGAGLGDQGDCPRGAEWGASRGRVPLPRARGVRARRRPALLRPKEADGLAGQCAAARGPDTTGGAFPGRAGAVGQRQVVGGAGRAGRLAERGGDRREAPAGLSQGYGRGRTRCRASPGRSLSASTLPMGRRTSPQPSGGTPRRRSSPGGSPRTRSGCTVSPRRPCTNHPPRPGWW